MSHTHSSAGNMNLRWTECESASLGSSYLAVTFYFTLTESSTHSLGSSRLTNKALVNSFVVTSDPCSPSLQINTLALHFLSS